MLQDTKPLPGLHVTTDPHPSGDTALSQDTAPVPGHPLSGDTTCRADLLSPDRSGRQDTPLPRTARPSPDGGAVFQM